VLFVLLASRVITEAYGQYGVHQHYAPQKPTSILLGFFKHQKQYTMAVICTQLKSMIPKLNLNRFRLPRCKVFPLAGILHAGLFCHRTERFLDLSLPLGPDGDASLGHSLDLFVASETCVHRTTVARDLPSSSGMDVN
jgi:hypothetical protein